MNMYEWAKKEVEIACKKEKTENLITDVLAIKVH